MEDKKAGNVAISIGVTASLLGFSTVACSRIFALKPCEIKRSMSRIEYVFKGMGHGRRKGWII